MVAKRRRCQRGLSCRGGSHTLVSSASSRSVLRGGAVSPVTAAHVAACQSHSPAASGAAKSWTSNHGASACARHMNSWSRSGARCFTGSARERPAQSTDCRHAPLDPGPVETVEGLLEVQEHQDAWLLGDRQVADLLKVG